MTRQQMKAMAKAQLGNQIFGNTWLIAVVVIVIQTAISYLVNAVPGIGQVASLLLAGPVSFGVAAMFLKQTRTGEKMDIGDIVGIKGTPFTTKTGEKSVHVAEITLLSKRLQILPEKFHGLTNTDLRYRQR